MPRKVVSRSSFVDQSKVGTRRPAGTRREYLGTVEAQWDCSSCGHRGIPGGTKNCPTCGNPKDGGESYQPPKTNAAYLTPKQLVQMGVDPAKHESDEECPYCGSRLKPGTQVCPHCGGNIKDAARTSRNCPNCGRETNAYSCPNCGADTESVISEASIQEEPVLTLPKMEMPDLSSFNWAAIGTVFLITLLIGGLLFALWPRQEKGVVSQAIWTSTVYLQEYQYNRHGDWSVPPGGDYRSEEIRIHHYDQVYDHTDRQCHYEPVTDGYDTEYYTDTDCYSEYSHTETTCYDDGSCDNEAVYETLCINVTRDRQVPRYRQEEVCQDVDIYRDEPRYATWYTYDIWEWASIPSAVVSGTGFEPYWPADFTVDEKHREAGREQTYTISFLVDDKTFNYSPSTFEEYIRYQIESEWIIKHSGGIVLEVKSVVDEK